MFNSELRIQIWSMSKWQSQLTATEKELYQDIRLAHQTWVGKKDNVLKLRRSKILQVHGTFTIISFNEFRFEERRLKTPKSLKICWNRYTLTVRNKFDTLQKTCERHSSNDEYENFLTFYIEAAVECIPPKPRAKCRVSRESLAVRKNQITFTKHSYTIKETQLLWIKAVFGNRRLVLSSCSSDYEWLTLLEAIMLS